jgi:UDP-sugar transporter A1/2/3
MKFFILFALVVQNTCTAILLRYISITRGTKFLFSTAILFQEIIKILISMGFLLYNQKYYKSQNFINPFIPWREVTKLIVPAALYAIQNCIHYLAPLLLDVPTMQVTYQLKIFTTALFLYVLLGRKLSYKQWSSLFLLASGVCLVHTCAPLEKKTATVPDLAQNKAYGICLVLLACIFSGFATVYYEKILKAQNSDIWIRNIQLGPLFTSFTM